MKLSIIIPVRNHSNQLVACLESIKHAMIDDAEVIVVDDASEKEKGEHLKLICDEYRCRRIVNTSNRGPATSANIAMDYAKGTWVYFCSATDTVMTDFFRESMAMLDANPQAGWCGCVTGFIDSDLGILYTHGASVINTAKYLTPGDVGDLARERKLQFIHQSSMIFNRQYLLAMDGLDSNMKWHCDWLVSTVLGLRHGACYIPKMLCRFVKTKDSYSGRGMRNMKAEVSILKYAIERLSTELCGIKNAATYNGIMSQFGYHGLLAVLLSKHRTQWLTCRFVKNVVVRIIQDCLRPFMPGSLQAFYLSRMT